MSQLDSDIASHQAKNPFTVTKAELDNLLESAIVERVSIRNKEMFAAYKLPPGYIVTVRSAVLNVKFFDEEIGLRLCYERALEKLWPLEGYRKHHLMCVPDEPETECLSLPSYTTDSEIGDLLDKSSVQTEILHDLIVILSCNLPSGFPVSGISDDQILEKSGLEAAKRQCYNDVFSQVRTFENYRKCWDIYLYKLEFAKRLRQPM
jgi:hypothetical protein